MPNELRKRFISGKKITLRDVEIEDAEFILSLRLDKKKAKFLSETSPDIVKQKTFITNYKAKNNEYYFIIESNDQKKLGTVRIYDIKDNSFCWGSWITIPEAPVGTALETAILIYEFAFNKLGFEKSHFDVRKDNTRVVDFHLRMGAKIIEEDELNYYFNYEKSDFLAIKPKYSKFL